MPLPLGYSLTENVEEIDLTAITNLLANSYWTPGISADKVLQNIGGSSLVVGVNFDSETVAFLRVVSDKSSFGWICDVIVHSDHQGQGLAQEMVKYSLEHPDHQGFRRWILATKDAHTLYKKCGFEVVPNPDDWMIFRPAGSFDPFKNEVPDDACC